MSCHTASAVVPIAFEFRYPVDRNRIQLTTFNFSWACPRETRGSGCRYSPSHALPNSRDHFGLKHAAPSLMQGGVTPDVFWKLAFSLTTPSLTTFVEIIFKYGRIDLS